MTYWTAPARGPVSRPLVAGTTRRRAGTVKVMAILPLALAFGVAATSPVWAQTDTAPTDRAGQAEAGEKSRQNRNPKQKRNKRRPPLPNQPRPSRRRPLPRDSLASQPSKARTDNNRSS